MRERIPLPLSAAAAVSISVAAAGPARATAPIATCHAVAVAESFRDAGDEWIVLMVGAYAAAQQPPSAENDNGTILTCWLQNDDDYGPNGALAGSNRTCEWFTAVGACVEPFEVASGAHHLYVCGAVEWREGNTVQREYIDVDQTRSGVQCGDVVGPSM